MPTVSDNPFTRLFALAVEDAKKRMVEDLQRPLWGGGVGDDLIDTRPVYGPSGITHGFIGTGGSDLIVFYEWDIDAYRMGTWDEYEDAHLSASEVDELIANLTAHRNRTLYP